MQQQEVLSDIYKLIFLSAENGFDEAGCRFEYIQGDDGENSVQSEFWYSISGEKKSAHLIYDRNLKPIKLVPKLSEIMLKHTGGKWVAFTLTIDKDGKAKANFEYPEDSNTEK